MSETEHLVPIAAVSVRVMDFIFSRMVAEAFGSIQIVLGAAFIALSLAGFYWKFEVVIMYSLVSEWFSFFWVLGGTAHILAGQSKSISLMRLTILFSIVSFLSTCMYEVLIAYQVERYWLTSREIGIYSGTLIVCVLEKIFSILAIAHCSKALCTTHRLVKAGLENGLHQQNANEETKHRPVQSTNLKFNKKIAAAFGTIQIITGATFISLSLAAIFYGYTQLAQISEWFSIFWVLGGTTHILAGQSQSVNMIRTTMFLSITSLMSTVVYDTILAYQLDRFFIEDRAITIYTVMFSVSIIEGVFAITTIIHCALTLCRTYTFLSYETDNIHHTHTRHDAAQDGSTTQHGSCEDHSATMDKW